MPLYEGEQVSIDEPLWQEAYKALLSSPMFLRVRTAGETNLPVSQARSDLGVSLQANVDNEFKKESVARAIAILKGNLATIDQGLTDSENQWLVAWNSAYSLGLLL